METRLNNSIRNLQVAWIGQFINILVKFVMRRYFVMYISDDYLGLDAVFTNIIGLMNLADLGIGSAAFYALYKPLAEHNEEQVLGVMQLLARAYRIIALVFAGMGILLMPLLTVIAPEARGLSHVHLLFGFYLGNTVASYLFTYKDLLASADQKKYIPLYNHYIFTVSLNVTQILIIYFTHSFLAYVALQTIFTLAEDVSLSCLMDRKYPILKRKDRVSLPESLKKKIWSDMRKIVVGRIGNTVISSTDNLILSNVVGLSETGSYSNYVLIKSSLQAIVSQFQLAVAASVGNIAASEEREKEIDCFWLLNFINTSLYAITSVCMFNLVQPFIAYWLGSGYLMSQDVLFCMMAIYYLGGIRGQFGTFSMAHGVFDLEAKKTIFEALTNLLVSITLAVKMGLLGVLLGTIISSLFVGLPMELINVGLVLPEISKRRYLRELIGYAIGTLIVLFFSMKACDMVSMHWYVRLPLGAVISVTVFGFVWCTLFGRTKMFRKTMELAKDVLCSRIRRAN